MNDDDLTPQDVIEYLVGVYRTVTRPDTVHVVNQHDELIEVVNALIVTLAPLVAYHLAHGHHSYDRAASPPAPDQDDKAGNN